MNLRIENKDVRIRLTEREWKSLNESGTIRENLELGPQGEMIVALSLCADNQCRMSGLNIQIKLAKESLQKPVHKKDPYWIYIAEGGVRWSLDVDIIPEEKR